MRISTYGSIHKNTFDQYRESLIKEMTDDIKEWKRKGFMPLKPFEIRFSDSHSDNFIYGLITILIECDVFKAPRIILKNSRHNRKRVFLNQCRQADQQTINPNIASRSLNTWPGDSALNPLPV